VVIDTGGDEGKDADAARPDALDEGEWRKSKRSG
jgi:hypothetical protein